MTRSPFADTRFEYEVRHLYFIQEDLYTKLEKTKPCYLIGSRGTGKTTLLRSLSWRERAVNMSLRSRLGGKAIRKFIGIYIKLPDVQLDTLRYWLAQEKEQVSRALYSRYLELMQLQEMFDAVSELGGNGDLGFSAAQESRVVKRLMSDFGKELHFAEANVRPPVTFADLSRSVRTLRRIVEKGSQQGNAPLDVLDILGSPTQFCSLSREVAERLATLIQGDNEERPFFKVCFDEAETLDAFGVQILATWVRLASGPLYHVISFVSRPESLSQTFLPNLTVQSADVELLDLDSITDRQFKAFAEGVASMRLKEFLRLAIQEGSTEAADIPTTFSTDRVFGKLNLNFLLEDTLKSSVSPVARDLLARAMASVADGTEERKGDDSALPIYETYLEWRTNKQLPTGDESKWTKRKITSQVTRKAMIAAYLSIMHEIKTDPRYAYSDMILQLSDSCIRDFLNSLEQIFRESKLSLLQFMTGGVVRPTIQHAGLKIASKAKVDSLPTHGVNHPSCTAKLIEGLGKLTSLLQSQSKDGRHLKSTERGIFELDMSANGNATERAVQLVVEAAEAGFLKIINKSELKLEFRVHTSLAPAFGFSYRGAYYPVTIGSVELAMLADSEDDKAITKLVHDLFERMDGRRGTDLFGDFGHA